jgi:hypothetical protein
VLSGPRFHSLSPTAPSYLSYRPKQVVLVDTSRSRSSDLMSQATNQPKVPLFAASESKFFLKVVDAQIVFSRNEKGEVTSLTLHQNGREINGLGK